MKGIVMAGGSGTRLYPITKAVSKQLLPVCDKPMIYYPISVLMLSGIRDILIISTPYDIDGYKRLFGDGSSLGLNIQYVIQPRPEGIAQAFILGESFIGQSDVCLILGDNIFYGQAFTKTLKSAVISASTGLATIFGYPVSDPSRFGVVEFGCDNKAISIEEKPKNPKSKFAVTGLYFYPNDVLKKANKIELSQRGELEITSVNNMYLSEQRLIVEELGRGFAWLDTGTHDSLMEAGQFVHTIERRQGFKIACLEEISFRKGWIEKDQLLKLIDPLQKTAYGEYLLKVANGY